MVANPGIDARPKIDRCFAAGLLANGCCVSTLRGIHRKRPLVFGVKTVLWPTAAKKRGKWYRGVVEAAECFMTVLYRNGAESSCLRHAREDAKRDDQGKKGVERQPY